MGKGMGLMSMEDAVKTLAKKAAGKGIPGGSR
jgi:hypothetical protein